MIKHNDSKKHNSSTEDKVLRDAGSSTKTARSTIAAQRIRIR